MHVLLFSASIRRDLFGLFLLFFVLCVNYLFIVCFSPQFCSSFHTCFPSLSIPASLSSFSQSFCSLALQFHSLSGPLSFSLFPYFVPTYFGFLFFFISKSWSFSSSWTAFLDLFSFFNGDSGDKNVPPLRESWAHQLGSADLVKIRWPRSDMKVQASQCDSVMSNPEMFPIYWRPNSSQCP